MIEAEGLEKRFGDVEALAGLDLAVPSGQVLAILGPNGAGKTTLIRTIATLTRPTAGTLKVAGIDVAKHPKQVRRSIGLAGQYAGGRARPDRAARTSAWWRGCSVTTATRARGRPTRCSTRWASPTTATGWSAPTPAACSDASTSVPASSVRRASCSSTSRPPGSTLGAATSCGSRSRTWWRAAPTCCSPPSTSTRPTVSPTSSPSSTTASSWRRAPATSSRRSSVATSSTSTVTHDADLERAGEALGSEATIDTENSRVAPGQRRAPTSSSTRSRRSAPPASPLDDIALRRPTLDDVFLTLTGHTTDRTIRFRYRRAARKEQVMTHRSCPHGSHPHVPAPTHTATWSTTAFTIAAAPSAS